MHPVFTTVLVIACAIASCTLTALAIQEMSRWSESSIRCHQRFRENKDFLAGNTCDRNYNYGNEVIALCEQKKLQNEMYHYSCVARLFWAESGLNHVYKQFADSKVMLFGLAAVIIYVTFHFMFAKWQHDNLTSLYKDTVQTLQQQQPMYNFQLPEPKRHYSKRPRQQQQQQYRYVEYDER